MSKELKKILKKPIDYTIYLIELIHTIPSYELLTLKKAVDLELLDRKYLKKTNSWFGKMLNKMRQF
jgi:hypothetical protein